MSSGATPGFLQSAISSPYIPIVHYCFGHNSKFAIPDEGEVQVSWINVDAIPTNHLMLIFRLTYEQDHKILRTFHFRQ